MEKSYDFNPNKINFQDYLHVLPYCLYSYMMASQVATVTNNSNGIYYLGNNRGIFCSLSLDQEGNSFTVVYTGDGDSTNFFQGMDLLIRFINIQFG